MLLQKAAALFASADWIYEPKWEGIPGRLCAPNLLARSETAGSPHRLLRAYNFPSCRLCCGLNKGMIVHLDHRPRRFHATLASDGRPNSDGFPLDLRTLSCRDIGTFNRVRLIDQDEVGTVARLLVHPTENGTARCNGPCLARLSRVALVAKVSAAHGPRQAGLRADALHHWAPRDVAIPDSNRTSWRCPRCSIRWTR